MTGSQELMKRRNTYILINYYEYMTFSNCRSAFGTNVQGCLYTIVYYWDVFMDYT